MEKQMTNQMTATDVSEQLFDRGMKMSWDIFNCPWRYLSPMQKFLIKVTVMVQYVEEWIADRFQKKS
jgi:pantothenate kinase